MNLNKKTLKIKTASILVIGDEVLSGQVQEAHVQYIAKRLEDNGIVLKEVRMIPDDLEQIVININHLKKTYDYLFTTGGIGGTHDDKTMKAISTAFGVEIIESDDIKKMVDDKTICKIPKGSGLIQNSIGKVPGFFMENVFCLAGFPEISKVMFEEVIKNIEHGDKIYKESITVDHLKESQIAYELEKIENEINETSDNKISIGSYPYYLKDKYGITFVVKGMLIEHVAKAKERILEMINKRL